MNPKYLAVDSSQVEPVPVGPGVTLRRLWRSGTEATARRALLVEFAPGSTWPGVDVHQPGPEEVFVLEGVFEGLTEPDSVHRPGTFLHFAAGTSHTPRTATGGRLFVYYPEG